MVLGAPLSADQYSAVICFQFSVICVVSSAVCSVHCIRCSGQLYQLLRPRPEVQSGFLRKQSKLLLPPTPTDSPSLPPTPTDPPYLPPTHKKNYSPSLPPTPGLVGRYGAYNSS